MPLPFETRKELVIPEDLFNVDGIGVVYANGNRYGGLWQIDAIRSDRELGAEGAHIGQIMTSLPHEDPDMAFDTAYVWINGAAVRAEQQIAVAENHNQDYPLDQRPFFMLGLFVVTNSVYIPQQS